MYNSFYLVIFIFLLWLAVWGFKLWQFYTSSYRQVTGSSFLSVYFDMGKYGEYLTYRSLCKFEKQGARFLFNCYLPRENGETTEIDVLMISRSGIYVFESKNYSGWIFGDGKKAMWTQTLPQGNTSHKEHFLNPIKQNQLHITWLKKCLQDETIPIHSIVVFSERCTLKKVETSGSGTVVIKRDQVAETVDGMDSQAGSVLEEGKIQELYQKLYPYSQADELTRQRHIENIEKRMQEKEDSDEAETKKNSVSDSENPDNIKQNICPKCGSPLVLRTAKKGEHAGQMFYGCSAYPKCRYIMTYHKET